MSSLSIGNCPQASEKRCHEQCNNLGSDGLPVCNEEVKNPQSGENEATKTNSERLLFLLQVALDPGFSTEKDSRTRDGEKIPVPHPGPWIDSGRPKFEDNTKSHVENQAFSVLNKANTLTSGAPSSFSPKNPSITRSISPLPSLVSVPTAKISVSCGYNPHDQRDQTTKKWVRKPTFAEKLMLVLSSPNTSHAIDWVPEGDSFFIVCSKLLVSDVLPRFFKEVKYESFTRKLNRWGFKKRIIKNHVAGVAYFHAMFLRENPDLCKQMRGGQKECTVMKSVALTESPRLQSRPVGAILNSVRTPVAARKNEGRSGSTEQAVLDPIRSSESIEKSNDVSNEESQKEWKPEEKFVPCYAPNGIDGNQQVELNSGSIVSPVTNPTPNPYGETISLNTSPMSVSHSNNEKGDLSEYWDRKMSEISEIYQHKASFSQGRHCTAGGNSKKIYPRRSILHSMMAPNDTLLSLYFRTRMHEISALYSNHSNNFKTQVSSSSVFYSQPRFSKETKH